MFHSATLKLTGWYLLILMTISLIFSSIIYQVATSEIDSRLENLQQRFQTDINIVIPDRDLAALRYIQAHQAEASLFSNLLYINLLFLAIGGIASYWMARRTLQPIENAHEAQSRFTSDASHELRTPLAAMKTELEVALRDPDLSKNEMRELLASNLEEVDKLSQISGALLMLSKLEHGSLKKERINITETVQDLVDRFNRENARVVYQHSGKKINVYANQISVEELVTILVDNALKYSPKNSKINVKLSRNGRKAKLQITNSGQGISPADLPNIFDRFYRADQSRTGGDKPGLGLGLSLAKKIVEMSNGDLKASSQPGKKTTFTVSLPLYQSRSKTRLSLSQQSKHEL